eukprot:CAMPEP_0202869684 /NCGR_PEP_ID=MMETSP1391-20130828/12585_1 /ASSEMBLY_ACC=CAM_ASM_000867 /TAXON_ID=1034604 /ORGANISM="Chlamydomonas leiostraca, Strain SAG 11-49" /LENGTH=455 /DNA_ID=CAMNT_0049550025 /DNA_START=24 /DNA_END=1391 /DNA_ORIENTATION=-
MKPKSAQPGFLSRSILGVPLWAVLVILAIVGVVILKPWGSGSGGDVDEYNLKHFAKAAKKIKLSDKTVECQPQEAATQLAAFNKMQLKFSSCSSYSWMEKWQVIQPEGKKVVVDVGCGYGLSTSVFVGIFLPELGLSKASMVGALGGQGVSKQAACGKCTGVLIPNTTDDVCTHTHSNVAPPVPHEVDVYCVDPSVAHAETLKKARAEVLGSAEDQVTKGGARLHWRVMAPLAFSDSEFSAHFPKNCTTTGSCSLKAAGGKEGDHDEIKVTTLDKFVKAEGLDKADIDLLRINAEGYDPKIIKGAMKTLSNQLPGVVVFEYKGSGIWLEPHHNLSKLVQTMEKTNYACYLDGSPLVFKLSHNCWRWQYGAAKDWTNVVCARRDHPVHSILESESHVMAQVDWSNTGGEWTEEHEKFAEQEAAMLAKQSGGVNKTAGADATSRTAGGSVVGRKMRA